MSEASNVLLLNMVGDTMDASRYAEDVLRANGCPTQLSTTIQLESAMRNARMRHGDYPPEAAWDDMAERYVDYYVDLTAELLRGRPSAAVLYNGGNKDRQRDHVDVFGVGALAVCANSVLGMPLFVSHGLVIPDGRLRAGNNLTNAHMMRLQKVIPLNGGVIPLVEYLKSQGE